MSCVVLPGVTEASWTAENKKVLEQFIVDTTATTLLVYLDGDGRLQVDSSAPSVVQKTLILFCSSLHPRSSSFQSSTWTVCRCWSSSSILFAILEP